MYSTGPAKLACASSVKRSSVSRALVKSGLAGAFAVALGAGLGLGGAVSGALAKSPAAEMPAIAVANLPPEARTTYKLIHTGGPFPYSKDGTVFLNRERLLPAKARGYYREYTVRTPRARDRGPRRIVCGGQARTVPDACYYTSDHYSSFSRIAPAP